MVQDKFVVGYVIFFFFFCGAGCGVEDSGGGMRWRSHQWLARLQAATEGLDHEDNESLQQDSVCAITG